MLHVVCSLTVLGQTHADVGEGRDPKAAFSDALKRAAVPFGIGRSIYAIPRRLLFAEESRRPPRDKLRRKGERLYLTEDNEALLREEYETWLRDVGVPAFGEPLDHGPDQAEAVTGDGEHADDAAPALPAEMTSGLRAISDGTAQEAPATIHERRGLIALIAERGYREETVKELAALTLGERLLDRLSRAQVEELAGMLEGASARSISDASLAERVRRARGRRDPRAGAVQVRAWLSAPAERERRAA